MPFIITLLVSNLLFYCGGYEHGKVDGRKEIVNQYEAQIAYLKQVAQPDTIKKWIQTKGTQK